MTSQSGWDKYLTGALIVLVVWFIRTMMDDNAVAPAAPIAQAVQPDTDAEHDVVYAQEPDGPSDDDRKRLDELGWHESEEFDCMAMFT